MLNKISVLSMEKSFAENQRKRNEKDENRKNIKFLNSGGFKLKNLFPHKNAPN